MGEAVAGAVAVLTTRVVKPQKWGSAKNSRKASSTMD